MYNPIVSSAVVGFYAFGSINNYVPHDLFYYYYNEEDPNTDAKKFEKRFLSLMPVERKTEQVCKDHNHPSGAAPIIYVFAQKIQQLLLNTSLLPSEILDDIVSRNKESLTFVELCKSQMDYIRQFNEFRNRPSSENGRVIGLNPPYALQIAAHVFETNAEDMTDVEHKGVERYARVFDTIKKPARSVHLINPLPVCSAS